MLRYTVTSTTKNFQLSLSEEDSHKNIIYLKLEENLEQTKSHRRMINKQQKLFSTGTMATVIYCVSLYG